MLHNRLRKIGEATALLRQLRQKQGHRKKITPEFFSASLIGTYFRSTHRMLRAMITQALVSVPLF
jgi:hypothetical protein